MSLYVIAKQAGPVVDSPVFHAGPEGNDEAVAVFTSRNYAQNYIDAANWKQQEAVVDLQPVEMLRWILAASDGGTTLLAVDPKFDAGDEVPQPTLFIPDLLKQLSQAVTEQIQAPPSPTIRSRLVAMDLLHCQKCGKLIEQKTGSPAQECCGETMTVAAGDATQRLASSQ